MTSEGADMIMADSWLLSRIEEVALLKAWQMVPLN